MLAPRLLSPDALRTEPACSAAPFRSNPHNHPRSPFILSWLRSCAAPAPAFDCRGRNLFLRWARRLPFCRTGLYFAVSAEESTKWKWELCGQKSLLTAANGHADERPRIGRLMLRVDVALLVLIHGVGF